MPSHQKQFSFNNNNNDDINDNNEFEKAEFEKVERANKNLTSINTDKELIIDNESINLVHLPSTKVEGYTSDVKVITSTINSSKGNEYELLLSPEVFSTEDWASAERLGFPLSSNIELQKAEISAKSILQEASERREKHWQTYSRGLPLLAGSTMESREFMRRSVWKYGIPNHLRGVIWLTLSGVGLKMEENEGFYRALLNRHGYMKGEYAEAIEKDLYRTFPGHLYFTNNGIGMRKVRNVLHAICWRNPLLNYCQAFNYLVAFILLILDNEEAAFWLICHLLENLLPNDLYSESLIGTKVDQIVLKSLVKESLPKLAQHFEEIHFDVGTLIPAWVMVLFVNIFPIETVLRIWDCLFAGNNHTVEPTCVPLEVVLAVLKLYQSSLLQCDDAGDVVICLTFYVKRLFDAEKLVRIMKEIRILPSTLQKMRRQVRPIVMEEHHQREKRRRELYEKRQKLEKKNLLLLSSNSNSKKSQKQLQEEEEDNEYDVKNLETQSVEKTHSPLFVSSVESHRIKLSDLPREPNQREYSDLFAETKEKTRIKKLTKEEDKSIYEVWEGMERWREREREESCGLEMESIRAISKEKLEEEEEEERRES